MKLIYADTAKCVKCGKCKVVCPMNVIEIMGNGFPEQTRSAFRLCINCGYCVDVCAFGAFHHKVRKASGNPAAALKRYAEMKRKGEKNEK